MWVGHCGYTRTLWLRAVCRAIETLSAEAALAKDHWYMPILQIIALDSNLEGMEGYYLLQ